MRKIMFRGKDEDTKDWLYGFYTQFQHPNHQEMKYCICTEKSQYKKVMGVIPETVGQFTGLTDKNEKEIYEGDIVNVSYPRVEFEKQIYSKTGIVRFLDTLPQFAIMENKEPNCVLVSSFNNTGEEWEIIGNIYDNPELLQRT